MASAFLHRTGVLIRLLLFLTLWLIGFVFFIAGLGLSPWGSQWLFEQAQSRGWVEAELFQGAPLDELTIEGLRLSAGPLDLAVERLHLAWAEDCLLSGRLCLDDLSISGADIRLAASETPAEPAEQEASSGGLPTIAVPFPIEVRQVRFDDVSLELANGPRIQWQHFETGALMSGNQLTLLPTRLEQTRIELPAAAEETPDEASLSGAIDEDAIAAAIAIQDAPSLPAALGLPSPGDAPESPLNPLTMAAVANISAMAEAQDPQVADIERQLQELRQQLPDFELPLQVEILSLVIDGVEVEGPTPQRLDRLELSLMASDSRIEIQRLIADAPDGHVELEGRAELSGDVPITLSLRSRILRAPIAGQQLDLDIDGSLADLKLALRTRGNAAADIRADLQAFEPGVPFAVHVRTENLRWPFAERPFGAFAHVQESAVLAARALRQLPETPTSEAQYQLDRLSLDVDGSLERYRANLELTGQGESLPPVTLAVAGEGNLQRFDWQPLNLASQGGELESRGRLRWTPMLSASVALDLRQLPLEAFTDAVTGQLDGEVQAAFAMTQSGSWQVSLPRVLVDGRLQQRQLRLEAQLDGNSDMQWNIEQLDFRQGNNRLTASGQVDQRINLDGNIAAPALDSILPQLSGALNGSFQGRGTLEQPQIALDLNGSHLGFADNRIQQLALSADTSGTQDPQFDIDLDARGIEAAAQQIQHVALTLDGRLSNHQLALDVAGGEGLPVGEASLRLSGGLDEAFQRYRGTLSTLSVGSDYGDIALRDSLDIDANLANSSATLSPFCLVRHQGGRLCLTERLNASAAQGRAALAIEDVPMQLANDYMPQGWQVEGETAGTVVAGWSQGGATWSANADIDSSALISGQDARGAPWQVPATTLSLSLDATQQRADAELDLQLEDAGRVQFQARIDDPVGSGALSGRLQLDDLRFAPYRPLVAGIDQLEGAINGDVTLGGNIAMPALDGNITIDGVTVRGGVSPVAVTDAQLSLDLQGQSSVLKGYVQSDEGRLELDGDANWRDPAQWRGNVNIDGTESPLLIALPAFGRLRVAPDLQIQAQPQRLQVRGDVTVPWARLELGQLPTSAQTPSSDTVIITQEEDQQRQAAEAARANDEGAGTAKALADAGMQLDVRVNLHLGPDMLLEAYGLEAGLRGELEVRQGSGPVQLYGDVNLIDGIYRSFGQDLIIRQGQVLFSGPASQPSLRFEAVRNPDNTEDDVTAGLRVTGQASAPRLTIFSEPAMTESRALSYILRGRAPEDSGGGDDALASALIGLSLSQTGSSVGRVGESFGVDDLSLDASGSGDDSQVVVSGYVFDDLKVSYGVGIFSPIAELTLRYRLVQNLYLQAVSGAAQAVDLIYTFSLGRTGGP